MRQGAERGGAVMFWFVDKVEQPQDRSLLPSDAEWQNAASQGAADFVDKLIREGKTK